MEQRFHKVRGRTLEEAYRRLRQQFGADAVVLRTAEVNEGGILGYFGRRMVEVTAAVQQAPAPPRRPSRAERRYQEHTTAPSAAGSERVAYLEQVIRDAQARMQQPAARPASTPVAKPAAQHGAQPPPATARPAQTTATPAPPPAQAANQASPVVPFPQRQENAGDEAGLTRELREMREMVQVLYAEHPGAGLPAELVPQYRALIERGVSRTLAAELVQTTLRQSGDLVRQDARAFREALKLEIRRRVNVTGGHALSGGECRVVALCGPTGVGKTTTLAKLAAQFAVRERARVALVTADTYRIAATEQLRVYAGIIGVGLTVVNDAREAATAVDGLRDHDLVLIDTAGGSQFNLEQINELKAVLHAARPHETVLVLAANTQLEDLRNVVANFSCCAPCSLLFTKIDETRRYGSLLSLNAETGLPIGYLGTGQNVPDDLRLARPATLANLVVEGKTDHA